MFTRYVHHDIREFNWTTVYRGGYMICGWGGAEDCCNRGYVVLGLRNSSSWLYWAVRTAIITQ